MRTLIDLLTAVLGGDHNLVVRLTEAKPSTDPVEYGTDEENAALAELAEITDAELAEIQAAFRAAAADDDTPASSIPAMMDAYKGVQFVLDARAEAVAAEQAIRDAALAEMAEPVTEEPEAEVAEAEQVAETADEAPEAEAPAEEAEPVLADAAPQAPSITRMANRVPRPSKPLPREDDAVKAADEKRFALLDGSASAKYARGDLLSLDQVAEVVVDRARQMSDGATGTRESYKVAGARWEYGPDRILDGDHIRNEEVITASVEAQREAFYTGDAALMASVCAPPTPLYDIPTIATTGRPVRDFLPGFQATRGGVIFRPGISLSSAGAVNNNSSGVTGPWSDGDSNKVVLSVDCPNTETATVEAIVARAEVSNMQGRFDPESVAARLRIQDAFWARTAEDFLLDQIDAGSTAVGPDITLIIGFTRQFLQSLNTMAAGIRNRERMAPDAMLDVLAPAWMVQAMQDDLSFEQPGAAEERLATTQAQIEDWLRVRNIRIGWFLDGSNIGDLFAAQSASANITDYPQDPKLFIFEPGHHLFLDGGELNLGIIRDSTLNNTNEYQTFYETFEQIASRGVVSYDVKINVCRTGTTGAAAEITCGEVS